MMALLSIVTFLLAVFGYPAVAFFTALPLLLEFIMLKTLWLQVPVLILAVIFKIMVFDQNSGFLGYFMQGVVSIGSVYYIFNLLLLALLLSGAISASVIQRFKKPQ